MKIKRITLYGILLPLLFVLSGGGALATNFQSGAFVTKWKGSNANKTELQLKGKDIKIWVYKTSGTCPTDPTATLGKDKEIDFEKWSFDTAEGQEYYVEMLGDLKSIKVDSYPDLRTIEQWGNIRWETLYAAFKDCNQLTIPTTAGAPDLTRCTSLVSTFEGCKNANFITINAPQWNVSKVQYFSSMFLGCSYFNDNVGGWNMSSAATMSQMFQGCGKFNQDLSNWGGDKLKKVRNFNQLFHECTLFTGKGLKTWNVSNVESFSYTFYRCINFNEDISAWKVDKATDFSSMFSGCKYFDQDISGWKVKNASKFKNMFSGCEVFKADLKDWLKGTNNATDISGMFAGCQAFTADVSGWDVSRVTDMSTLFYGCKNFHRDLRNWKVGNVTNMAQMFEGCGLFNCDLSKWEVSKVTNMSGMFSGCTQFSQNLSEWKKKVLNVTDFSRMFNGCSYFTGHGLEEWNVQNSTNFAYMFFKCKEFVADLSLWKMENALSTRHMFNQASKFNSNISKWRLSNLEDASGMFSECHKFEQDLSGWRMPNLKNMSQMFYACDLFHADLSNWDVSQVKNFMGTFCWAKKFNCDLSGWDVSNATDMSQMFLGAQDFAGDISKWDVSNVTDMHQMFLYAYKFNSDLSAWDVSNVEDMSRMFEWTQAFNADLSKWNVSKVTNMERIFSNAKAFDCSLGKWDLQSLGGTLTLAGCNMSIANYDRSLIGWNANENTPTDITVDASSAIKYLDGETAHDNLTTKKRWTFVEDQKATLKKLALDKTEMLLDKGTKQAITATVSLPANPPAVDKIKWKSSDPTVAVYHEATKEIEGLKVGKAIITAEVEGSSDRAYDLCFVTVAILTRDLNFKQENYNKIPLNESFDFAKELVVNPNNVTDGRLQWESQDQGILEIDKETGLAVAKAIGPTKITVRALDGSLKSKTIDVAVVTVPPTKIEVIPPVIYLKPGQEHTFRVDFTPASTTDKSVKWTSSSPYIETLVEGTGYVKLKDSEDPNYGGDYADLTVSSVADPTLTATCRVNIMYKKDIVPNEVKILSERVITVKIREERKMKTNILPEDAQNKTLLWWSSDDEVLSVDQTGKIVGLKEGTVDLRASSLVNKNAFDYVKVHVKKELVTKVEIQRPSEDYIFEIPDQVSSTIPYKLIPENASDLRVKFESFNTDIVEVDPETNRLIGKTPSSEIVKIRITALGGSNIFSECNVRVVPKVSTTAISIDKTLSLVPGEKGKFVVGYEPTTSTDRLVMWATSDDQIIKVGDDGSYQAVQAGDAEITVTLTSNHKIQAKCKVKVLPRVTTTGVTIIQTLKLGKGAKYTFAPQVEPANATDQELAWTVVEGHANIEFNEIDRTVVGKEVGTAKVRVSLKNYPHLSSECVITIEALVPLTSTVAFEKESYEVEQGKTLELPLKYTPKEANNLDLSFRSADDKTVSIQLHPNKYGHALVRGLALTEAGKPITVTGTLRGVMPVQEFSTTITVTPAKHILPAPATFAAKQKTITVLEGATGVIALDVDPDLFDIRKLNWTSSDPLKCPVENNGVVSPTEKGTYTVTISSASHSETVKVEVVRAETGADVVDITAFDAPATLTVVKGATGAIVLSNVQPANGSLTSLSWTSSKTDVATVNDKGVVTSLSVGETTITIKAKNDATKEVMVKVIEEEVAPVDITAFDAPATLTVVKGATGVIVLSNIQPANGSLTSLSWTSSKTDVATVNDKGVVTALSVGETTVTIKAKNDATKEVTVKVIEAEDASVEITAFDAPETLTVVKGATGAIVLSNVQPANGSLTSLSWTSSKTDVATVNDKGIVTALTVGETTVTIKAKNDTAKEVTVKVIDASNPEQPKPALENFEAPESPVTVVEGNSTLVNLKLTPADGDTSKLTWTSSDEDILTVKNGVVTGVKAGEATITVKDENDKSIEFKVKVVAANSNPNGGEQPALEDFSVQNSSIFVVLNYQATIQLSVTPANADISGLQWSSANDGICVVNKGIVTGMGVGETTITVKDPKSSKEFTVNVTVVDTNTPVEEALLAQVAVAPNPFAGQLRIAHAEVTEGAYALLNASGVVVRQGVLEGSETVLDTADVPAGLYLLQLRTANGVARTVRVVKY